MTKPPTAAAEPSEVILNPPRPHGAGESPMAITMPLGSSDPPRSREPEEPKTPKVKEMLVSSDTVKTIVAIKRLKRGELRTTCWVPAAESEMAAV